MLVSLIDWPHYTWNDSFQHICIQRATWTRKEHSKTVLLLLFMRKEIFECSAIPSALTQGNPPTCKIYMISSLPFFNEKYLCRSLIALKPPLSSRIQQTLACIDSSWWTWPETGTLALVPTPVFNSANEWSPLQSTVARTIEVKIYLYAVRSPSPSHNPPAILQRAPKKYQSLWIWRIWCIFYHGSGGGLAYWDAYIHIFYWESSCYEWMNEL